MKFLLAAVNAKYIHSNPAVYSLKAYAGEEYEKEIESLVLLLESEKKETKHLQQLLEESSDLEQKEFDRQKLWEEKEKKVFAMLQKVNKELEQEKLQYEKQLENLRSELEQEKQSILISIRLFGSVERRIIMTLGIISWIEEKDFIKVKVTKPPLLLIMHPLFLQITVHV